MEIKNVDGTLTCILNGQIDTLESQKLEAQLKEHISGQQPVSFDLQGVTYICSAFLRVCLYVAKTVGAANFSLVGLTPPIKRVFKMAGMSEIFNVE
ncbi:MAG: STAS domain-containing protein [Armatimonadota bacterium]